MASRASKGRRFLALYLDYLAFTALQAPLQFLLGGFGDFRFWPVISALVFLLLRTLLIEWLGASPGRWALGIQPHVELLVDPGMQRRESWWTMLAGTLLVLEGSKNLVRWTEGLPPPPVLGVGLSEVATFAAISLLGALNVVAGLLILRTQWLGVLLAVVALGTELLSSLIHRGAYLDWSQRAVVARRALQGIPIRRGEAELAQWLAVVGLPLIIGVALLGLLAVERRFRAHSA